VIKKYWNRFVHAATAISATIAGFVAPPPDAGGDNPWIKFGRFFIAVCIGLWYVPSQWWGKKANAQGWWIAALILATGSFASGWAYEDCVHEWTIDYYKGHRVVMGKTMTSDAERDLARMQKDAPWMGPIDLLKASAGDPSKVWQPSELEERQRTLTLLYLLTLLLLASTVVTISQGADCASKRR
jgi:hypothetical protein